jgi:hypothetical protein
MTASTRPHRIALALAAGLTLVAAPTAWAVADTTGSTTDAQAKEQVIRLSWTRQTFHAIDNAPTGLSSGDTLEISFALAGGVGKGSADYSCTAVTTHYLCDGVLRLPAGDIYVSTGPIDDTLPAAILGGTLSYQGVRGEFTKTATADGGAGTYTLSLKR